MKWFRFYAEFRSDPKMVRMPICHRYAFIVLLCLSSDSEVRGTISGLDDDDIAYALEMSTEDWQTLKAKFRVKGLIELDGDTIIINNWDKRQFESDSSASRVAAHRARRKAASGNADVTLQECYGNADVTCVTASEADSDSDSEKKKEIPATEVDGAPVSAPLVQKKEAEYTSAAFNQFWQLVPLKKEKAEAKQVFCRKAGHRIALAEMTERYKAALREHTASNPADPKFQFFPRLPAWLRGERWADEALVEYLNQPTEPVTSEQSAELDEWIALIVKAGHVKDAKIAPSGGIRVQYLSGVWGSGSAMLKQHPVESLKSGMRSTAKRSSSATLSRAEGTQAPAMVEPSLFESSDTLGVF
jgi:hypothetical protein